MLEKVKKIWKEHHDEITAGVTFAGALVGVAIVAYTMGAIDMLKQKPYMPDSVDVKMFESDGKAWMRINGILYQKN